MRRLTILWVAALFFLSPTCVSSLYAEGIKEHVQDNLNRMLGEELTYEIAFLWFDRVAVGTISLTHGPETGQYTALLQAKTEGVTAFLTRNRVERIETVMEFGQDGSLRPLVQKALTIKGEGRSRKERVRSYTFDYADRSVNYRNRKTGSKVQEKRYPMDKGGPVYDLLSAFYNVRAGVFGPLDRGRHIALPTFSRRGTEDIIVARVVEGEQRRHTFFPADLLLCRVLVDPDTFGTKGRGILVGFDDEMTPLRAVVKDVIGMGDVRGVLLRKQNRLNETAGQNNEGKVTQ